MIRLHGKRPADRGWPTGPFEDPDGWRDRLVGWVGNVGLVTGRGLVVVDLDLHKPGGPESAERLEAQGLPATREALTGSGGRHLFFRTDRRVPSRPMPGYAAVDVRGDGGQVVVAPSVHPVTGVAYRWANGLPVAVAPRWLAELVACTGSDWDSVSTNIGPDKGTQTVPVWTGGDVVFPLF